jgi:hypothetical protein
VAILALQHQLAVYHRSIRRPQVRPCDRLFESWLARRWARWREALVCVQPATVLAWQRTRFRTHWGRLSRTRRAGRPAISQELRDLIRQISTTTIAGVGICRWPWIALRLARYNPPSRER